MKPFRWLSVVAVLLTMAVPLVAGEGLREDAAEYAKAYGVTLDEAVRRLELQRAISELEREVAAAEADSFAGMWIEHTPKYRVVARFTNRAAEERLLARVAKGPLAGLVETRGAKWSLADLEKKQKDAHERANQAVKAESRIDVVNNSIEVITVEEKRLNENARMPEGVAVRRVEQLSTPDNLPELLAGSGLSEGTAGFGVITPNGEVGILTSGHIANEVYYQGIWLPFRAQRIGGDQDVQWNSGCDRVYISNRINTGIGTRGITSTRHRTNQTTGTWLCKYGKTTLRTCGTLKDKNIALASGFNPTGIRVDNTGGGTLRGNGDSGAPWFVEDIAYGVHWGGWGGDLNDALYMAINYLGGLNVSVLTYDPGPVCNLTPQPYFTVTKQSFVSYLFDASGSTDPDGTIASYTWDFGDGEIVTTSSPTITHAFGAGEYLVILTVTDNEGKSAQAWTWVVTCGGYNQPECPY